MKIRFRVWDGEKMHYPGEDAMDGAYMLAGDGTISQYRESVGMTCLECYIAVYDDEDGIIAMLSTGRKDVNVKEMWEGDIIVFGAENIAAGDYSAIMNTYKGVVIWWKERAGFAVKRAGYGYPDLLSAFESPMQVFGNIHENPELLKEVA